MSFVQGTYLNVPWAWNLMSGILLPLSKEATPPYLILIISARLLTHPRYKALPTHTT